MADSTILTITGDERFLNLLRGQLHDQFAGSSRMIVASTIDEACSLLPMAHPRLIVVHWTRHGGRLEELNRLLWATTVLARQVPVLVVADRYRIDQATTFYRMGVTEYVSRTHHADQFGRILDAYLPHSPASTTRALPTADESGQPANAWSSNSRTVTAQVV
jgi:DNA-binding NarL/FixJ family response regulator